MPQPQQVPLVYVQCHDLLKQLIQCLRAGERTIDGEGRREESAELPSSEFGQLEASLLESDKFVVFYLLVSCVCVCLFVCLFLVFVFVCLFVSYFPTLLNCP